MKVYLLNGDNIGLIIIISNNIAIRIILRQTATFGSINLAIVRHLLFIVELFQNPRFQMYVGNRYLGQKCRTVRCGSTAQYYVRLGTKIEFTAWLSKDGKAEHKKGSVKLNSMERRYESEKCGE
jgi:hypothetical protein